MNDYEKFMENYGEKPILEGIQFVEISEIDDVFENIFE
jgi:hypothetical protein